MKFSLLITCLRSRYSYESLDTLLSPAGLLIIFGKIIISKTGMEVSVFFFVLGNQKVSDLSNSTSFFVYNSRHFVCLTVKIEHGKFHSHKFNIKLQVDFFCTRYFFAIKGALTEGLNEKLRRFLSGFFKCSF